MSATAESLPKISMDTVAGIARHHGRERPDAPALTAGDRAWSFGELDRRSSQVAMALSGEGVGPEDRIAFLDKNAPEYFDVLFGGAKLGAVSVAVNWRLAPAEVAYVLNDAQARVLVVGREFVPVLEAIEAELTTVEKVVVIDGHPSHEAYDDWKARSPIEDPGVASDPDDVVVQMYTSGTTGRPKGAMLTNRNLFSMLRQGTRVWEFTPDSVNLVAMPLFHIGGSGWALVSLSIGAHSVLLREAEPAAILRLIPEHRITHALLVPAVLGFLLAVPDVERFDLSSLRYVVYGASPISLDVLTKSIETLRCGFIQGYGLTETTGAIVSLMPEDHDPGGPNAHRLRSAGTPMGGVEIRIVDPSTGVDQPTGAVGEIWVRSGQVMKGYWRRPEDTAASITPDGWLRTGDAGYLDPDGYLFISDRVKDMIISGGENIYPAEVEDVLMSHPAVADVAVIGVPSEKWGETPKAIVVREAGTTATADDLIAYCRERLARYKSPTSVEFAAGLPRNPAGKILKRELRAPYWEGRGSSR
jgi:long-chain acyl-CoA synthetase